MTSDRREPCRACDGSLWSSAPAADGSLRRQKKGAGEQGFRLVRRRLAFRSSGHPIQNRTSGSAAPARTEDGQLPTRGRRKYPAASRPVWRSRALAGTGVNGRKTEIETEPLSRKVIISFLLSEFMLFCSFEISTVRARSPRRPEGARPMTDASPSSPSSAGRRRAAATPRRRAMIRQSPRPPLTRRKPLIRKGRAHDKACRGLTSLDRT